MSDTSGNISKLDANQVLRLSYDDENNRLRVAATVTASVADVEVQIDASDGDNISIADRTGTNFVVVESDGSINVNAHVSLSAPTDSVAISDGVTPLAINPNGSINVVLTSSGLATRNIFNEISGVVSGVTSTIVQYTAIANTNLLKVDVGGTNIAAYSIYIASALQAKKYTFYQTLNESFDFKDGLPVNVGDVISVEVLHNRPDPGDFNASMLIKN